VRAKLFKLKWSLIPLCLLLNLSTFSLYADESPLMVRYGLPSGHEFLHEYKIELIHEAFEITRLEFGNYEIDVIKSENPTDRRKALLINEGKLINLVWANPGTVISNGDVIEIPVDILHGLLGYRICLKNAATASLKNVASLQGLMKIKIGQSEEWPDVNIYRANHIKPVLTPGFSSLFEMLGYKRFDCLPLGANEVVHVYEEKKQQYPFLAIDDQLLIYYKFPIYFYVSKAHPGVARRLESGLKKLQANGDFDAIFRKHHEQDLKILNLRNRHLVCLESPFIDERDQCKKPISYPDEWLN
jgi:hypothetical protein